MEIASLLLFAVSSEGLSMPAGQCGMLFISCWDCLRFSGHHCLCDLGFSETGWRYPVCQEDFLESWHQSTLQGAQKLSSGILILLTITLE